MRYCLVTGCSLLFDDQLRRSSRGRRGRELAKRHGLRIGGLVVVIVVLSFGLGLRSAVLVEVVAATVAAALKDEESLIAVSAPAVVVVVVPVDSVPPACSLRFLLAARALGQMEEEQRVQMTVAIAIAYWLMTRWRGRRVWRSVCAEVAC